MSTAEKIRRHWLAELNLGFVHDGRRTILSERRHTGPLVIQKPFYPEDKVCHVYILHPPAGIVGGDELRLNINVEKSAHALVTTPAATKFYRGNGFAAEQVQHINVDDGCKMEWLPQETIFFSDCDAKTKTIVNLKGNASFTGWEIVCLGRPASKEDFDKGICRQYVELWRDDIPVVIERSRLEGNTEILEADWGMQGKVVMGTLITTNGNNQALEAVRTFINDQQENSEQIKISITLIDDILICRLLADEAEPARESFIAIWKILRPFIMQREAVAPRIWYT